MSDTWETSDFWRQDRDLKRLIAEAEERAAGRRALEAAALGRNPYLEGVAAALPRGPVASCAACRRSLHLLVRDGREPSPCHSCAQVFSDCATARRVTAGLPVLGAVTPKKGQAKALEVARAWATRRLAAGTPPPNLLLRGSPGVGKTHLMRAAYRELLCPPGLWRTLLGRVKYVAEIEFFTQQKRAIDRADLREDATTAIWEAQRCDALFWDDLWLQQESEWRNNLLYTIFDRRRDRGLPTFFTTNCDVAPSGSDILSRLASRIYGGSWICHVTGGDHREDAR